MKTYEAITPIEAAQITKVIRNETRGELPWCNGVRIICDDDTTRIESFDFDRQFEPRALDYYAIGYAGMTCTIGEAEFEATYKERSDV